MMPLQDATATTGEVGSIAVLGLGTMGLAFAANLAAAGFAVRGYNRGERGRDALAGERTETFAEAREAVRGADAVIMMLSDAAVTQAILADVLPALAPGALVVQMATIGIDGTDALARLLAPRLDVSFFDAPVSGTRGPAIAGTVTVLASGPAGDARARAQSLFDIIGGRTVWLGEAGAGTRMKLVLNAWLVAVMNGIAEAAALGRSLDIDYPQLAEALAGGPLAAPYATAKLAKMAAEDYSPDMALKWAVKDAVLAQSAHTAAGGDTLPGLQRIAETWSGAVADGRGDDDLAVVHTLYLPQPSSGARIDQETCP